MPFFASTPFVPQFFDDEGDPLSGGTLEAYIAGTSTPVNMYSDTSGTVLGTTVTLNARGEPETSGGATTVIFLDTSISYKFILKDAAGNSEWTNPNFSQFLDTSHGVSSYSADTGSANTYVISPDSDVTAYAAGQVFRFKAATTNTGASTLNVSGVGAVSIKRNITSDLVAGDIQANEVITVVYDGTNFQLQDTHSLLGNYILNGNFYTDSGSANTYVLAASGSNRPPTAYVTGQIFVFKAANANTGASTVNVNSVGATALKKHGQDLADGDIRADEIIVCVYDGTDFEILPTYQISKQSYKNYARNGGFLVDQRMSGSAYTSASTFTNNDDSYVLDGWILLSDGNDIVDVQQSSSASGAISQKQIDLDVETANKKFGILKILTADESHELWKDGGGSCSVALKSKSTNSTLSKLRVAVIAWDSTADSVTSDIVSAWGAEGTNPTLATNWTYENTPAALTALTTSLQTYKVENISLNTAGTNNLAIFIWSDDATTSVGDILSITDVMWNPGQHSLPFTQNTYEEELGYASRFLWHLPAESFRIVAHGHTANTSQGTVWLPTQMRSAPTLITSGTAGDYSIVVGNTNTACTSIPSLISGGGGTKTLHVRFTSTGAVTTEGGYELGSVNSNGFLAFSAEL